MQTTEHRSYTLRTLMKGNPFFRVIWSAPALAIGYAAIAYAVITTGCIPPFLDVEFFGVRVTYFLLFALTGAALTLIIFAGMNALRVLRILRRRHSGEAFRGRRGFALGALAVLLAAVAFAATAWVGWFFFVTPCA